MTHFHPTFTLEKVRGHERTAENSAKPLKKLRLPFSEQKICLIMINLKVFFGEEMRLICVLQNIFLAKNHGKTRE